MMRSSAILFSSLRRVISASVDMFPASLNLLNGEVLKWLRELSLEVVSSFSGRNSSVLFFQGKNSRSLIRRIGVISLVLDALEDSGPLKQVSRSTFLFLKELYFLLHRYRYLIDYIEGSSRLWLLLQNSLVSSLFHDMNLEMSTLLDVLPLKEINLPKDVKEQVVLLRKQSRKSKFCIDEHDDMLRSKLYCFLNEFEDGSIPPKKELYEFFVEKLGICNVEICRAEIDFLEKLIENDDGSIEPAAHVLNGFVALLRYIRFLIFNLEEEDGKSSHSRSSSKRWFVPEEAISTSFSTPKYFCCPISLDLMHDPVVVSTGQTYDRASIAKWIEEGNLSCPMSGQVLDHTHLMPNLALRSSISQWCMANGIPYDPPEISDYPPESSVSAKPSKAAALATKATAALLVHQLEKGTPRAKTVAAKEIRHLAKSGSENRACIADAGAIPFLNRLLSSADASTQENSVTALLNLSIYDMNKGVIMDLEGCLGSIVAVLRHGKTTDARENAAATLFSLSVVHEYKKRIANADGALDALVTLLRFGTPRGKRDAVTAVYNLSTHPGNCSRILESEAVPALVGALNFEQVSDDAAGVLALIVKHPAGAEAVGREDTAVLGLIQIMRYGSARGRENAVTALLNVCRNGGAAASERVLQAPPLVGSLHSLLCSGSRRAKRKAASLTRLFRGCESPSSVQLQQSSLGYAVAVISSATARRDARFAGDVSLPVTISVPVL